LEPEEYKEAYKRFVDITREEGVNNVAFVWHSYAAPPYKGYALGSWYPGDDYVDWVAVSLFGHMYGPDPGLYGDAVFDFAKTHKKPVMVAESSPIYGIFDGDVRSWNTWFVNYFSLAYERNIKAISFINTDWRQYPPVAPLDWQDARLQNNETVAEAWFMETAKDRYLKQSPTSYAAISTSIGTPNSTGQRCA
jgi:beta-mannanase